MDSNSETFKIETRHNSIELRRQRGRLELYSGDGALQSVILLEQPHRLALKNLEYLASLLLFVPAPQRILLLGTAAGSLLHFLRYHYAAEITAVDIDGELVEQLLQRQVLPPADTKLVYVYDDAAHFLAHCRERFDLVLVDIFAGAQTPRWLLDKHSLESIYRVLADGAGMGFNLLIDSTHDFSRFYRNLRLVCERQTLCTPVEGFANTIAFGFRGERPRRDLSWYLEQAQMLSQRHGVNYLQALEALYTTNPDGAI